MYWWLKEGGAMCYTYQALALHTSTHTGRNSITWWITRMVSFKFLYSSLSSLLRHPQASTQLSLRPTLNGTHTVSVRWSELHVWPHVNVCVRKINEEVNTSDKRLSVFLLQVFLSPTGPLIRNDFQITSLHWKQIVYIFQNNSSVDLC